MGCIKKNNGGGIMNYIREATTQEKCCNGFNLPENTLKYNKLSGVGEYILGSEVFIKKINDMKKDLDAL